MTTRQNIGIWNEVAYAASTPDSRDSCMKAWDKGVARAHLDVKHQGMVYAWLHATMLALPGSTHISPRWAAAYRSTVMGLFEVEDEAISPLED